jgi:hypothetical protein
VALIVAPRYGHNGMAVTAVLADVGVALGILFCLSGTGKAPWRREDEPRMRLGRITTSDTGANRFLAPEIVD